MPASTGRPGPSSDIDARLRRAHQLQRQGRWEEAGAQCLAVLRQAPAHAGALLRLGLVRTRAGDPAAALEPIGRAIAIEPTAAAHAGLGHALRALKRNQEAVDSFDLALALEPDQVEVLFNRGNALRDLKQLEPALASYERVLALRPDHARALNNRGAVLRILRRYDEALASYDHALTLTPDDAGLHNNRGNVLLAMRRHEEALASYQRALELKPDHAGAHWNEGLCRLLLGDLAGGWRQYEWRWQRPTFSSRRRDFDPPLWRGERPLAGQTILLHAEQGLGDTIQFCRYAELVAAQGATVVLEVQPPLQSLMRSLRGPAQVLAQGQPLPDFDCHCPLLSLPLAFDTRVETVPAPVPYLSAPEERSAFWRERLGPSSLPRVGLVWSGQPKHRNDHNRSMSLSVLAPLLGQRAGFVSLQKELRAGDRDFLDAHPEILNLGVELDDFADTAGLVDALDLVIAVDTSVAHLAGALGKPVWVLLPFTPDWRWLLHRPDSPWYPTARLFRQPAIGDWGRVIASVAEALATFASVPAAR